MFSDLDETSPSIAAVSENVTISSVLPLEAAWPDHCPKIMKPPQSLPLQMVERLLRAQPDSVANHVTRCLIFINVSNALKYANMSENFIHHTLTLYVHGICKNT